LLLMNTSAVARNYGLRVSTKGWAVHWYLDKEVHCYFPNGGEQFERLAEQWGLEDRSRS